MSRTGELRLTLLGVGSMNSPRYAPAGLLIECDSTRVMIDGGPGAEPKRKLTAWLVTDEQGELIREIRKLARRKGIEPVVARYLAESVSIKPHRVVHTNHATYGYLIQAHGKKIVWSPEFLIFPRWAKGADLMFAEAAGWSRPILFRGGVGGHASVEQVSRDALKYHIKRLIFAHIGRPTIKAIDVGKLLPFGELGEDGSVYRLRNRDNVAIQMERSITDQIPSLSPNAQQVIWFCSCHLNSADLLPFCWSAAIKASAFSLTCIASRRAEESRSIVSASSVLDR